MAMRVVFMGTPSFAVPSLKALHQAGYSIVGVYTQPPRPAGRGSLLTPSPVQQYAETHHLPLFTPTRLLDSAVFNALQPDVVVVVAYGLLLPSSFLSLPPYGCINLHPSALPRWRGAAPLWHTLRAGDTESALCIMRMDAGCDTGPILSSLPFTLSPSTNHGDLETYCSQEGAKLLLKTLPKIQEIVPFPQSSLGVTYAHKVRSIDRYLAWNQLTATEALCLIRACSPSPGAWAQHGKERILFFDGYCRPYSFFQTPGTVVEGPGIVCKEGVLFPTHLQRAGKKRLEVREFVKGYPLSPGSCFD